MLRRGEVRRAGPGGHLRAMASERVEAGERFLLLLAPRDAELLRQSGSDPDRPAARARLPILFEDEHMLAFDKPAGTPAHPGSGHPLDGTVLGALLAYTGCPKGGFRPSLVGRLDRDASGVQLAGVSLAGLRGIEALSRSRQIRKLYLALVRDPGLPRCGQIDAPLVDLGSGRARMRAVRPEVARDPEQVRNTLPAETAFRVLNRVSGLALLEVEPRTGRRHQIRSHLASAGAPLAGDSRYGRPDLNRELARRCGLRRLFLHCARVELPHPVTGRRLRIDSPLPPELSSALEALGIPRRPRR